MENVYYIGGSTCCGKSTVAEHLAQKHGMRYYKLDDFINDFMTQLAQSGHETAARVAGYSMEQMWMRAPETLCREETDLYEAMFPLAAQAIAALPQDMPILTEGAGFLPALAAHAGIQKNRYICFAPSAEFQKVQYSQRPWIHLYLEGCADPQAAFANWMQRDILFAEAVLAEAKALGYPALLVDGSAGLAHSIAFAEKAFGLDEQR